MFYRLTPAVALRSPWQPYWARPGERVLTLKSMSVFPPSHPTTRLCLDLLRESLSSRPARRLLDVGCGSGVLGLAGAALGAPFCLGVDLSRRAVRLSQENARNNGLADQLHALQGSTECLRGPFELILANLPWAVQMAKTAELHRLAAADGVLILSGFRDTQEEELLAVYQSLGWTRRGRLSRDEWLPELPPERSFTWVAWTLERPGGKG